MKQTELFAFEPDQVQTQPQKIVVTTDNRSNKEICIDYLRQTQRQGMERVIEWLDKQSDFFVAPASTNFHGNYEGGLLEHSLNVLRMALEVYNMLCQYKPQLQEQVNVNSIIIAALLHDVCKANIYKSMTKYRKDKNNMWETYTTYGVDYTELPVGHGEKSVIRLLQMGLALTEDEILAIRWHMSAWELADSADARGNLNAAKEKCPLLCIIQTADGLASAILEEKRENN